MENELSERTFTLRLDDSSTFRIKIEQSDSENDIESVEKCSDGRSHTERQHGRVSSREPSTATSSDYDRHSQRRNGIHNQTGSHHRRRPRSRSLSSHSGSDSSSDEYVPYFSDPARERDRLSKLKKRSEERRQSERRANVRYDSHRRERRDRQYHKRSSRDVDRRHCEEYKRRDNRRNIENSPRIIVMRVPDAMLHGLPQFIGERAVGNGLAQAYGRIPHQLQPPHDLNPMHLAAQMPFHRNCGRPPISRRLTNRDFPNHRTAKSVRRDI